MAFLQVRRQATHQSGFWPDPQLSIGQECKRAGSSRCWSVTGPALEAFGRISEPIQDLLNKHVETLEQGEPKPRAISFDMWMVGSGPASAQPTIIISSKSKRQRMVAKALIKDSKILHALPGMDIKTLGERPAIHRARPRVDDDETLLDSCDLNVYLTNTFSNQCGAAIAFGISNLATMGGTIFIDNTLYGMSAQHARFTFPRENDTTCNNTEVLCFDDDDEDTVIDEAQLVEITSRGNSTTVSLLQLN